jgi:hypothetical protein
MSSNGCRAIYVLAFAIEVVDKPKFKLIFVGFELFHGGAYEDYYLLGCDAA